MITGISSLTARRIWFVPNFIAWGTSGGGEAELLVVELAGGERGIFFQSLPIGDAAQEVLFSDLVDHRGNSLPDTLASPRVVTRSRSEEPVFVIGAESPVSFQIARGSNSPQPVTTDLLIIEMGD